MVPLLCTWGYFQAVRAYSVTGTSTVFLVFPLCWTNPFNRGDRKWLLLNFKFSYHSLLLAHFIGLLALYSENYIRIRIIAISFVCLCCYICFPKWANQDVWLRQTWYKVKCLLPTPSSVTTSPYPWEVSRSPSMVLFYLL